MIGLWIAAAVIVIFVVLTFNGLIARRNHVDSVFGTVDAMLKKRYDLIPNLVATVQAYAAHERGVLSDISRLREQAMQPSADPAQRFAIGASIGKLLGGLMARVENYPQLKANENFMHLQRTLTELEEQISAARRTFNAAVQDYNNSVEMFPSNIIAGMMGFRRREFFEINPEQRGRVEIGDIHRPPAGQAQ